MNFWKDNNESLNTFLDVSAKRKQLSKKLFLMPSEIFVTKENYKIATILGSCVSICLFDPIAKISGINHFMLPLWNGDGLASPKYGNIAILKLIGEMEKLGAKRNKMTAKIFGGLENPDSVYDVGKRNIEAADTLLKRLQIKIITSQVAGKQSRKIVFDTHSGDVYMKYID
ncbi:chemotaxis protein CheD [Flexithrix dorotheae]|uniref:chemotaxis protein CheD n=1 Tax=Flexithrix dorotheae TaxID=70993 RepID=UPI0003816066|nr:chemotaxis protein CheD [Flexithrix dorotheae]